MVSARRESERSRDRAIKSDTGAAMRARRRAVARQGHVIGQRQSASPSARGTTRKHAPPADGAFHDVRPQRSRDGDRGERRLTLRRSQERARIRGAFRPQGASKSTPRRRIHRTPSSVWNPALNDGEKTRARRKTLSCTKLPNARRRRLRRLWPPMAASPSRAHGPGRTSSSDDMTV